MKCAIVDDEFLARQYLSDYVRKIPFLELVGDYNSPLLLLEQIQKGEIDLLFLDIQMPDVSGIEFLKGLENPPKVILTTAFKEYAIEGYELNVVDYLLKPISFERFLKAVNKLKLQASGQSQRVDHSGGEQNEKAHIIVRADRKYYKINHSDLIYVEGQKAYVTFHEEKRRITALASLKDLEESLPQDKFIRVHKSFIVSIAHLQELEGNVLRIGEQMIPIGKLYRSKVEQLFGL